MKMFRVAIALISLTLIVYQLRQHQPSSESPSTTQFTSARLMIGTKSLDVRVPQTSQASEQGLSGVASLTDEEGMYWQFQEPSRPNFWMKDMLIPLDFVWIRDGVVTEITANVPAPVNGNLPLYQPKEPVTNVLEVSAGFAQRYNIRVGTRVAVE